jgi:conserved oligomeric Golgi complex subunit 8
LNAEFQCLACLFVILVNAVDMTGADADRDAGLNMSPSDMRLLAGLDDEDDSVAALVTLRGYLLENIHGISTRGMEDWPGFDSYIEDLCSYGIENLSREPESLGLECSRIRAQLEDVSCSNYRALIESFECAGAVRDGVRSVRARLDELISALPPLAGATRDFSASAANAQSRREEKLRNMAEHGRVMDILEMPRLMKALVAGELYEEALELHSTSLKFLSVVEDEDIVLAVCSEVEALTRQMVLQLVAMLRGPVPLPTSLRVVGYLRRLRVFPEIRLRMLFLQCRGDWLRSTLDSSVAPNAQAKLVRLCDDTRAMLFEIVTQYRAAFADDDDFAFGAPRGNVVGRDRSGLDSGHIGGASVCASILCDWTSSCVGQYLDRLETGLRDVRDGSSLGTVLQQAMYCGQSLGRVGADFRPALAPIFESAVIRTFKSLLTSALRQFEMMIEDHRWAPVGSSALRKGRPLAFETDETPAANASLNHLPDAVGGADSAGADLKGFATASRSGSNFEPPAAVLDNPSLAVFLNGVLAALNELRPCALLSLCSEISESVTKMLLLAAECVSAVGGPGGAFLKTSDQSHFVSLQASLQDLCVPHVARCLDLCMSQQGLLNVRAVQEKLTRIFGKEVAVPSPSRKLLDRDTNGELGTESQDMVSTGVSDSRRSPPVDDLEYVLEDKTPV